MNIKKILTVLGLSLIIGGCYGVSIHPLYTDEDLIFEPALVGNWMSTDSTGIFIFEGKPSKLNVNVTVADVQGTSKKSIHLLTKEQANFEYKVKFYDLQTKGDTLKSDFEGHLLRLGEYTFLDLFPKEPQSGNSFYNGHLIPLHSFWKVYLKNDSLYLATFNFDWLKEMVEQKKVTIKYEIQEDNEPIIKANDTIIFTASPKELQSFILRNIENAFFPMQSKESIQLNRL